MTRRVHALRSCGYTGSPVAFHLWHSETYLTGGSESGHVGEPGRTTALVGGMYPLQLTARGHQDCSIVVLATAETFVATAFGLRVQREGSAAGLLFGAVNEYSGGIPQQQSLAEKGK